MFTKFTKTTAVLATLLALAACGGAGQDGELAPVSAKAPLASAAPVAASVGSMTAPAAAAAVASAQASAPASLTPAGGAPMFSSALQGTAQLPAQAAAAPAEASGDGVRVVAWEQSYSLEMNRRHEEQLVLAQARSAEEPGADTQL